MLVVRPSEDVGSSSDSSEDIKWKIVAQMIDDYTKIHPKEIGEILTENKMIRESIYNEYASSKEGLRWGFRLPPGLLRTIERKFSDVFSNKNNIHKFMELFPGFRVCDVV